MDSFVSVQNFYQVVSENWQRFFMKWSEGKFWMWSFAYLQANYK